MSSDVPCVDVVQESSQQLRQHLLQNEMVQNYQAHELKEDFMYCCVSKAAGASYMPSPDWKPNEAWLSLELGEDAPVKEEYLVLL